MTSVDAAVSPAPVSDQDPALSPHPLELAGLLQELTAALITAESMPDALQRLAARAAAAVPGTAASSVTLIRDGAPRVHAYSAPAAQVLDDIQFVSGRGPGLDATRTRTVVTCTDLATDERWPEMAQSARKAGVRTVAAFPLDLQRSTVGAVTLFGSAAAAIGPSSLIVAMAVVGQAEVLLHDVARRMDLDATAADTVAPLRDGSTVDHAIGVIVAQRGCGVQEAYEVLHETAQRLGLQPGVVAERLVQSAVRRAETP